MGQIALDVCHTYAEGLQILNLYTSFLCSCYSTYGFYEFVDLLPTVVAAGEFVTTNSAYRSSRP